VTLDGEVLKAESQGDTVALLLQAKGTHWAPWRDWVKVSLSVRAEESKFFPVGRLVRVTVSPR